MIATDNVSVYLPLRRARLRRRLISGHGITGGEIIYKGKTPYVAALNDVSFTLNRGDCVALIGKNGSGKTTLLRTLSGIFEPTKGSVSNTGTIATMFSSALSLSDLETGRQNIEFSGVLRGIKPDDLQKDLDRVVEICALGSFLDVAVSMYSDGMRARLGLAMAIIANPDIYLIDEAMTAADTHYIDGVVEQTGLFQNPKGLTVLATHAKEIQDKYCNKAIWLDAGHLKQVGPYAEVRAAYEAFRSAEQ